jgi:lipoyl(octanoyl) transferase
LLDKKASFYKINRGGDITYHGPGQIVAYPILDLDNFKLSIKKYIYSIEEAVILTLKKYEINASRLEGATGVWLDPEIPDKARKICAVGVRASRWVTMHGLALNINTDLNYFNFIHPCGMPDKVVTSLEKELGAKQDLNAVKKALKQNLARTTGIQIE